MAGAPPSIPRKLVVQTSPARLYDDDHPYQRPPWRHRVCGAGKRPEPRPSKRKRHISGLPADHPVLKGIWAALEV